MSLRSKVGRIVRHANERKIFAEQKEKEKARANAMRDRAAKAGLSGADYGIDSKGVVWICIDSVSWGGNHVASRTTESSRLFWTGYRGQVAEEWIPV